MQRSAWARNKPMRQGRLSRPPASATCSGRVGWEGSPNSRSALFQTGIMIRRGDRVGASRTAVFGQGASPTPRSLLGFLARFSGLYSGRFLGRGGWLGLRPLDGGNPDDQCLAHAIGSNSSALIAHLDARTQAAGPRIVGERCLRLRRRQRGPAADGLSRGHRRGTRGHADRGAASSGRPRALSIR